MSYFLDHASRDWIIEQSRDAGFDLAGIASVPEESSADAARDAERFAEWVTQGRAGEMEWLKRVDAQGELLRGDLRRAMPWARSVIVCAANYNTEGPRSIDPGAATQGWIARYAWSGKAGTSAMSAEDDAPLPGSDYHDVLLERLRAVEAALAARFPEAKTRRYVDTGPIVERGFAARAGIGWTAKNTCIINQGMGSWLLLGVIVTSLELLPEAIMKPSADRCGTCTRCMDACPTDALIAPRVMDAARCISYLTIEKRGPIDEALRPLMGRQVFGCDICQDVCPWNRRAPVGSPWSARKPLVNPELEWLAAMDGPEFNRWFRGTPLERTRRKRILRNVAIAMGNSGDVSFLPRLQSWSEGADTVLADAARWAIVRLQGNADPEEKGPEGPAS